MSKIKLCLIFMMSILFPIVGSTVMSALSSRAFTALKVIAKKFQMVNPKMEYAVALEKAVGGFREMHASRK